MAKDTQIKFREDSEIKRKAAMIFRSVGLDTSTAIRMFLREVVQTRRVPLRMASGYTAAGERKILKADRDLEKAITAKRARPHRNVGSAMGALKREAQKAKREEE